MKNGEKIYNDLRDETFPLFESGKCEIDSSITDPADKRRGLTLRAMLSTEIISQVEEYSKNLKPLLPNQYFTPSSDLHLTVLTVVSCNAEFRYDPMTDDAYCKVIEESIKDIQPPQISFRGITASPSCLLLCGYPENDSLKLLRNRLRERFKTSQLPNSVDFRYPLKTAHATIMRFTENQGDISEFTQFIKANDNCSFGTQIIDEIEFVANDWCHKKNNTKIIRSFELN